MSRRSASSRDNDGQAGLRCITTHTLSWPVVGTRSLVRSLPRSLFARPCRCEDAFLPAMPAASVPSSSDLAFHLRGETAVRLPHAPHSCLLLFSQSLPARRSTYSSLFRFSSRIESMNLNGENHNMLLCQNSQVNHIAWVNIESMSGRPTDHRVRVKLATKVTLRHGGVC